KAPWRGRAPGPEYHRKKGRNSSFSGPPASACPNTYAPPCPPPEGGEDRNIQKSLQIEGRDGSRPRSSAPLRHNPFPCAGSPGKIHSRFSRVSHFAVVPYGCTSLPVRSGSII